MQSTRINIHSMQNNLRRRLLRVEGSSPYDKALMSESAENSEDLLERNIFLENRVRQLEEQLAYYTASSEIAEGFNGGDVVPNDLQDDMLAALREKYTYAVKNKDIKTLEQTYGSEALWRELPLAEARILADCLITRFKASNLSPIPLWIKFI